MFLHLPLIVGLQLEKVWYDSIWEKLHNVQEVLAAASLGEVAGLTLVSVGQMKSKDSLAQMIETMHFVW